MQDDMEKRTEVMSTRVGERMALDILRLATLEDRSPAEWMYLVIRQRLYGDIVRTKAGDAQEL